MLTFDFDRLPDRMKNDAVRKYCEKLKRKKLSLVLKRLLDILVSLVLTVILSPVLVLISLIVVIDSKGPVFYRQERITKNMKTFRIFKFRTMVDNADRIGPLVTTDNDSRITRVGRILRKVRLDELPQLFNILAGDMTLVGTRPEVRKYVDRYTDEMMATLLLPAGVTSTASIKYKDESELLDKADDPDRVYVEKILPEKMKYNLEYLDSFSFIKDIGILISTVVAVLRR
ncbi:MAG: sugar transferase [Oscillospiraceae bacterium]|nr:sugar transferase [Oscillospiraceae bacterium]